MLSAVQRRLSVLVSATALLAGTVHVSSAANSTPRTVTTPDMTVSSTVSNSRCPSALSAGERERLLTATARSGLNSIDDVAARLATINDVFLNRGDARGTFPLVYSIIVNETYVALQADTFTHRVWAERLAVEFAAEYLRNLEAHLRGSNSLTTYWRDYYRLAADCTSNPAHVVSQGIINHLVDDLPRTLRTVGTSTTHRDDYDRYGLALVAASPQIIDTFALHYDVDLTPLFQMYVVGDVIGTDTATTAFFTSVRTLAWNHFQTLRFSQLLGRAAIAASLRTMSAAVATLAFTRIL